MKPPSNPKNATEVVRPAGAASLPGDPAAAAQRRDWVVVFDLGGVLVRICRGFEQAAAAAGLPFKPGVLAPAQMEARKQIRADYEAGVFDCEGFYERIARSTQGLYSAAEFRRMHHAWLLGLYPGVVDLLNRLDAAGVTTGVLSNTNPAHWSVLADPSHPLGIAARVRHPHASHLLGANKPDAEIYSLFETRTGARPGNIVFFDDLPENVAGARARGWTAFEVDHTGDPAGFMGQTLTGLGILPGPLPRA